MKGTTALRTAPPVESLVWRLQICGDGATRATDTCAGWSKHPPECGLRSRSRGRREGPDPGHPVCCHQAQKGVLIVLNGPAPLGDSRPLGIMEH